MATMANTHPMTTSEINFFSKLENLRTEYKNVSDNPITIIIDSLDELNKNFGKAGQYYFNIW